MRWSIGIGHLVAVLAGAAVALAFADAMLSLTQRYLSSRVGEGLIYDLRVALFDHVQRMPLAFFTRTQTGSLQSRLNNDVIGAQQAGHDDARNRRLERHQPRCGTDDHVATRVAAHRPDADRAAVVHLAGATNRPRMQKLTRQGMQLNADMNNLTSNVSTSPAQCFPRSSGIKTTNATGSQPARLKFATSVYAPRSTDVSCSLRSRSCRRSYRGRLLRRRQPRDLAGHHQRNHRRVHDLRRSDVPAARTADQLTR